MNDFLMSKLLYINLWHINLSFWRVVIHLDTAESGLWAVDGATRYLHCGWFYNGDKTRKALSIIILPFSISIGFAGYE